MKNHKDAFLDRPSLCHRKSLAPCTAPEETRFQGSCWAVGDTLQNTVGSDKVTENLAANYQSFRFLAQLPPSGRARDGQGLVESLFGCVEVDQPQVASVIQHHVL